MKFSALFLSSIFYLLSFTFLTAPFAHAIEPANQNPYIQPNTTPDVPKNLHTYTQNVIIEVMSAVTCQLTGIDPVNQNQQCLGVDQKTGKIGFVPSNEAGGGAIGVMGKMISILYTPPLHTGDYFNHLAQNFGITKPAYAQGTGFEGLKPLLKLWTAFRNIVYLIFTIVFVVIGLAIMFRVKIDPRTVMTIQNQIPKIIVGIVLVTFSYAIAGFLIDIMYSSIYLIGNIITSAGKSSTNLTGVIQADNPFSVANQTVGLGSVIGSSAGTVGGVVGSVFDNPIGKTLTGLVSAGLAKLGTGGIDNLITDLALKIPRALPVIGPFADIFHKFGRGLFSWAFAGVVGATAGYFAPEVGFALGFSVASIVIIVAILWSLFRLWFILIYSYIYILIDVVFAPFWIAGGVIPGQPITFGGWLRHILSYIAAFPTTIALFLLGKVFIEAFGTGQKGFVPPLIGNPTDTNALGAIIGLGIILLSSNVVNITTKLFKAPRIDLGRIGQAIGIGVGLPTSTIKGVGGTITASREIIARTAGPGGEAKFGRRGLPGSFFGRMFGR